MILTRTYDLDIIPGGFPLIIRVSRNDSSSALVMRLRAGKGKLEIPSSGVTACVRGRGVSTSCSVATGGVVTVPISRAMTGKIGRFPLEIVLTCNGKSLMTATFYLDVM